MKRVKPRPTPTYAVLAEMRGEGLADGAELYRCLRREQLIEVLDARKAEIERLRAAIKEFYEASEATKEIGVTREESWSRHDRLHSAQWALHAIAGEL